MEWKAAGYAYSAILLQSSVLFFEMVIMLIAQLRLCFKITTRKINGNI